MPSEYFPSHVDGQELEVQLGQGQRIITFSISQQLLDIFPLIYGLV